MSKSRFTFNLGNRGRQTPAEISWLQGKVQDFTALLTGLSWITSNEKYMAAIMITGYVLNTTLQCVGYKEECTVEPVKGEIKKDSL